MQCTDSCEKESQREFNEKLKNFQDCNCPDEGIKLCKKCYDFWPYILHHLKDIQCKKDVCTLWYVSSHW